ncbi:hypothetical protein KPH14_001549 [Odynerus spinipes]|uniref:26S proteasome regulatory subunit 6B n=1 Tax=Odynerus spinipes TaxID=1348599 RepID=A0AAD9RUQ0_9HYME|nr:hypothetical protein KPH14_001549 [Odynerus spinipes]
MEEMGIILPEKDVTEMDSKPVIGHYTGAGDELDVEDLYTKYKKLQRMLEFLEVQEEYIKDEQRNLKKEYLHAQEEVKRIQSVPLVIGQFLEAVDQNTGIVGSTTGSNYYVRILSTIDRELLKPSASVALHKHSNALVDVLPPEADSSISMLQADEKPDIQYSDIGGMDMQKQEIREAVELPLTHFELYKQIGIDPPRGVLMYGPPGCGKTMLAKAVARHTTAAFIRVVGSEFVQKYLGEGPRMVRDVFRLAKENSPAIIFVDEIDAIATKRFDAQTGADREVQRILLELLNQMDGFDQTTNVKVIMATNRADTLDPALLRPGRLDRKIEFPLPDRRQKRLIFSTITAKMNLSEEVDLEDYVARPDRISGADINAICQEAGMHAVRENRYIVLAKDFEKGYKNNIKKDESEHEFYNLNILWDYYAVIFTIFTKMPLFSNKFSPKKTPTRKASAFLVNKDLTPKRLEKELGPDVGPIRIRLGDQEAVFDGGLWIPETGKVSGTFKENERLKKEIKRLEEENNLLKLKFEVMLDMLTETTAEAQSQREELEKLRSSISSDR